MNRLQIIILDGVLALVALAYAPAYCVKSIVKYFKASRKPKAITLHNQLPLTSELMDRFMPAVNTNDLNNHQNHE